MKRLSHAFALLAILAVSACVPSYQTRYNYEPPLTAAEESCTNQCKALADIEAQNRYDHALDRWLEAKQAIKDSYSGEELEEKLDRHKRREPRLYEYQRSARQGCSNRSREC